jgi:hypothetical protein|nr:hypothetical protein [Rhodococcus sp. (in: high G+C Gram-positive bacteria)]
MWGSGARLADYLQAALRSALAELDRLSPDDLLSENEDVLVAELLRKHMPRPVSVDWDGAARSSITEVTTTVRDHFYQDRTYTVPASKVTVQFPLFGAKALLEYQASTFSLSGPVEASIGNDSVALEIVERSLTPEAITSRISSLQADLNQRAEWANTDLHVFTLTAEEAIRKRLRDRKERILNDRKVEEALGIPVVSTGRSRLPVPAKRKQIPLGRRRNQSGTFAPEPVLDESIYRDVLQQVRGWADSLERTPGTASKLHEEELRDLLLGMLNGYWQGAAGGELFNGEGKTDILVRHDGRNVFIGELKIWRGTSTVEETVNQILRYLVWRDSKAAIVMFIKVKDPKAVISRLHAAVERHPLRVLTKPSKDPTRQVDYVFTANDEGRRISLAVIPVVIQQ